MKKEAKKLSQLINKVEGNVLVIGLTDEKLLQELEQNSKITNCNLLNANKGEKTNGSKKKKQRNFNIRNLRKKFHKKKVDYIICNMGEVYPYKKTFIKDSVYINRKKLYFYGKRKTFELDPIIKRYQKYHARVEQEFIGDFFFITISNEHSKTTKPKDLWFSFCDFWKWFYEVIGDLLIN